MGHEEPALTSLSICLHHSLYLDGPVLRHGTKYVEHGQRNSASQAHVSSMEASEVGAGGPHGKARVNLPGSGSLHS